MDNATLQAIIGHLNELKTGQEEFKKELKMDIRGPLAKLISKRSSRMTSRTASAM
jgi:hypothetical protein